MLIVALELENVKSYEHARFTFTPGVNAIVGHNGAGKSTIIEAIGFVLFDALPYTTAEFVREGARSGLAAVTFLSAYDERPYRIERRFGGSSSYAVFDEELKRKVCDGKVDVMAFVRRHMLADSSVDLARLFNDALGVAQGTLTSAFLEAPAQRKKTFDALLQVDDYAIAFEKLREPQRHVKDQIVEADRTLAAFAARLEQLPLLEQAIAQRARELEEVNAALVQLETAIEQNQQRLTLLETQKAVVDTLTAQAARLEQTVQTLIAQQERAGQALAEAERAAAAVTANLAGHDAYLAAQQQQELLQERVRQRQILLNKQAQIDKEIALSAARCTQIEHELTEVAAAEAIVRELADAVQQQSVLEERVTILERAQSRLAELDRRIAKLDANRQKLAHRLDAVRAGRERALVVEAQGKEVEQRLVEMRVELEQMREQAVWLRSEIATVEEQSAALEDIAAAVCPVCEQPLTADHRADMLARNQARLIALRRQIEEQQAVLSDQERTIASLETERAQLQREWNKLPREAEEIEAGAGLVEAERELAALRAERQQIAADTTDLLQLRRALADLNDPRSRSLVASARAAQRLTLETQLAVEQQRQREAQIQGAALEESVRAIGDLDSALQETAVALREHNAAYQAVLSNRQIAESLPHRRAELAEVDAARQRTAAELAAMRVELECATKQFDLSHYQQLLLDDRKMREELGGLSTKLTLMRRLQVEDETHLQALRDEESRKQALEAERQRLAAKERALEAIRSIIRQAGPYVTEAIVRRVSEGAATIFGELMQDHRRVVAWETDYGVTLTTDGVVRSFRQLSGGEQMSAALAVRLALVREMSNVNVAFFDEPTANLDSVRRELLAQQIMTVRGFNQLFVISHDDTFEQSMQNLIRVRRHGNTTIVGDVTE
jgi:exonuclease SbcC